MPAVAVTVGLSSNVTRQPLPSPVARRFVRDVRAILTRAGATVYVDAARSRGEWQDAATGETVREESRTWIADVPPEGMDALQDELSALCVTYEQDAIALTRGETVLVP